MLARELIEDASFQFGDKLTYTAGVLDADGSRITESTWLRFIGDALRNVILIRPDSKTKIANITLTANTTLQELPSEALRLVDIIRNMGVDGSTPGFPVTIIKREHLDNANLTWHTATAKSYIDHFTYELQDPYRFWVYPMPNAAINVQAVYSYLPTLPTASGDTIDIKDVFWAPLIHWMLYKAYTPDDEAVNMEQAIHHFNGFYSALGQEIKAGLTISPIEKE